MESLELFNIPPKEKNGEIQDTEIEYLIIAFSNNKKKEMIKMLEYLCDNTKTDVYADYLFKIIKEIYEKDNSQL